MSSVLSWEFFISLLLISASNLSQSSLLQIYSNLSFPKSVPILASQQRQTKRSLEITAHCVTCLVEFSAEIFTGLWPNMHHSPTALSVKTGVMLSTSFLRQRTSRYRIVVPMQNFISRWRQNIHWYCSVYSYVSQESSPLHPECNTVHIFCRTLVLQMQNPALQLLLVNGGVFTEAEVKDSNKKVDNIMVNVSFSVRSFNAVFSSFLCCSSPSLSYLAVMFFRCGTCPYVGNAELYYVYLFKGSSNIICMLCSMHIRCTNTPRPERTFHDIVCVYSVIYGGSVRMLHICTYQKIYKGVYTQIYSLILHSYCKYP